MNRVGKVLLSGLFLAYIFIVGIYMVITPELESSEIENRELAQQPEITVDTITDGTFMHEFEDFFTDQFPGRDVWLKAYINFQKLTNKTFIYKYFVTDEEWIIGKPTYTFPKEAIGDAANNVNAFGEYLAGNDVPLYYFSAPHKVAAMQFVLPDYIERGTYTEEVDYFMNHLTNENVISIDMGDTFAQRFTNEEIKDMYFKTDHHWNITGAIEGYKIMIDSFAKNNDIQVKESYTEQEYKKKCISTKDFIGSYNKQLYMTVNASEELCTLLPTDDTFKNYEITANGHPIALNDIYGRSFHSNSPTTSYAEMYTTDLREITITNPSKESQGKHLLIIKDSYANALVFHVAQQFYQTTVYDPRYNRDRSVYDYVNQQNFDAVAILYNSTHLTGDNYKFDTIINK